MLLLLPLPKNSYALDWPDLWRTKDQQAQQAFRQGDYGTAAQLFENPDWKAAAQYKAGQEEFGTMKTPKTATGFYNQGNVLAKSGRYEEALSAYDEALKRSPDKKLAEDAKANKEIVKKALEKQKQQQNQQKQQNQDDKQQQSKDDSQQKDSDQADQSGDQQKPDDESDRQPSDKPPPKDQQPPNKPEQEKQDAEKSRQPGQQDKGEAQQQAAQKPDESPVETKDEATQASEQWLNRIPDDPAGLLKRKFLYQYGQQERQPDRKKRSNSEAAW